MKREAYNETMTDAPKCIDLFSGCGGFTSGFASAGFNVVGNVEFDKDAQATHEMNKITSNFPNCELIGEDITKITDEEIIAFRDKHGKIPVIIGGPPCQSFSWAGRRLIDDPRNNLFLHYVRFVKIIQPEIFILENVPGLTSKKNKEGEYMIDVIRESFHQLGYKTEYALINCANYEVPQLRRRIIIMGSKDPNKIRFPLPVTMDKLEGTEEKITDRKKIVQIKRCPRCNKNYASRVYLEDKSTICMFCHEHQKNMENKVFEPCEFKERHVVIPKDVPIPATRFDFVQINRLETRKTKEGETNFIYSYFKDEEGEDCPYWSRPSEYRKCVDNDEECDEAEIFIMSNLF